FQAEDGIRDWSVTGVQTCALPISRFAIFHYEARYDGVKRTLSGRVNVRVVWIHGEKLTAILKHESKTGHHNTAAHSAIIALNQRSEERRVGKECRSGWELYH